MLFIPLPAVGVAAGQAVGRPLSLGYVPFIQRLALLLGVVLSSEVLRKTSWESLVLWTVVGSGVASLVSLSALPRAAWHDFVPRRSIAVKMLKYSWAIPLGTTAAYLIQWVDGWVIRLYADTRAVGLYNWAYQVISLGTLAFSTFSALVTPRMIDASMSSDRSAIRDYSRLALTILSLFSCLLVPLLPFISPMMSRLISTEYTGAYPLVLMLTAALPFLLIGYLVAPAATAFAKLVPLWMLISLAVFAIKALLDLILVPILGNPGAAIATGVALLFSGIAQTWIYSRSLGLELLPIGRAVLFSLPPSLGAAAVFLFDDMWRSEAVCLLLAAGFLFLLKQGKEPSGLPR
jgi:O-antigen/teichoic acid export membrane protein